MVPISLTGRILKGRYCILEKIAGGGEGDIYLARDMELGTLWAVKELPLEKKREAEYYGAAEPPVRCGESHLSGLTEPPHFVY